MVCISKYILAIGMIILIACIGSVTAAVPQVCAKCSPETYPGSDICPKACKVVFPADAEWTYPEEEIADEEEEINDEETLLANALNELLTSRFRQVGGSDTTDLMEEIEAQYRRSRF